MLSIPILVILQNDTEITSYKNRMLLPFAYDFLSRYSIMSNSVVICSNDLDELLAHELGFGKIYKYDEPILSDKNTFKAVNRYFLEQDKGADWCIILKPYRIITDTKQLIRAIQNINSNYDLILFRTSSYDQTPIEIDNTCANLKLNKMGNSKRIIHVTNDALQIGKVSFLNKCYLESDGDVEKYSKLVVSGKIKYLDCDDVQMNFCTIEQVDNFVRFISDIKYKSHIV